MNAYETKNWDTVIQNIQNELTCYIRNSNIKSLVLGVSGGIDSALCAALVYPVCKNLGIKLIGRSLTIETNKPEEIERAQKVGRAFCDDFQEVDLGNMYRGMIVQLAIGENETINSTLTLEDKIRLGNVKARTRMVYLYNLAQKYKGMVLSTDNLSERFLGFWTLAGDIGDFAMIQNLWKTEVYSLSIYMASQYINGKAYDNKAEALNLCINGVATDGLGITVSDVAQLQAKNYSEVDMILKTWLTDDSDKFTYDDYLRYAGRVENYEDFIKIREQYKNHPVVLRYERTHFKRDWPHNINRSNLFSN